MPLRQKQSRAPLKLSGDWHQTLFQVVIILICYCNAGQAMTAQKAYLHCLLTVMLMACPWRGRTKMAGAVSRQLRSLWISAVPSQNLLGEEGKGFSYAMKGWMADA